MKRDDFFREKFFKIETFGNPRELTITSVRGETFERNGLSEIKPAMSFQETKTKWVVSMTAFDRLCGQFRSCETDEWIGSRIRLHVDHDAKYNDRPCPQFRADVITSEELEARAASGNGNQATPWQTTPKASPASDDTDIPF